MNAEELLRHYERVADAPDAVGRLRRFVLDLAIRGKLVAQRLTEEPASTLLAQISDEKIQMAKVGQIKSAQPVLDLPASVHPFLCPPGWAMTDLQSVCVSVTDGDHLPPPKAATGVPFLVIGNVRSQEIDFANCRYVSAEYYNALDEIRRPRRGDLLYTLVGSFGIPILVRDNQPFCVQRHIGILRPSKIVCVEYLARAMESRYAFDQAVEFATGIAQKTVSLAGLRRMRLPLPPLAEQHRIVSKVDELMALCDRLEAARAEREAARDRLAAASLARLNAPDPETFAGDARFAIDALPALTARPDQIKQLRQTIHSLAVQGKLLPQNPDEEPAEAWYRAKTGQSADAFEESAPSFDLPSGWVSLRMSAVFEVAGGIQKTPERTPRGNAYPYLGVANVYRGRLDLSTVKEFELTPGEIERRRLLPGDLLIIEGNGSITEIGRCAKWSGEIADCVHQNHVIRCRPCDSSISDFTLLVLNSPVGMAGMQRLAITSSGLFSLSVGKIRQIEVPIPPLAEQRRIVAKVDELMALCDQLEGSLSAGAELRFRLLGALLQGTLISDVDAYEPAPAFEATAA